MLKVNTAEEHDEHTGKKGNAWSSIHKEEG